MLNCSFMLHCIDFDVLENLQSSLEPAKLAVEVLSQNDATLYSAMEFTETKLLNLEITYRINY